MKFKETKLKGAYTIEIEKIGDDRGFFARAWCKREFQDHGLTASLAQANIAFNRERATLRGMHYQLFPFEEAKLIRCIKGKIFDVMIDLRPDSVTYKEWVGIELSEDDHRFIYVPENFAHGYLTLSENTEIFYQVSQFYTPESERGLRWDDPTFGIKWPLNEGLNISEKDQNWPFHKI